MINFVEGFLAAWAFFGAILILADMSRFRKSGVCLGYGWGTAIVLALWYIPLILIYFVRRYPGRLLRDFFWMLRRKSEAKKKGETGE